MIICGMLVFIGVCRAADDFPFTSMVSGNLTRPKPPLPLRISFQSSSATAQLLSHWQNVKLVVGRPKDLQLVSALASRGIVNAATVQRRMRGITMADPIRVRASLHFRSIFLRE